MSEGSPSVAGPTGIVLAHGDMAAGLVDAVRRIAGSSADVLVAISNDGKSPDDLRTEIAGVAEGGPAVVFVDLQAGSCCTAALASCRACADRVVVTGVNLPMLLDFVFNRSLPFDELVARLVDRAREAIKPVRVDGPGGR
jgi:mannose/fructose-specific phosphotransferase system component IIA